MASDRLVRAGIALGLAFAWLGTAAHAWAADPENCLSCHRFRGLSRLDPTTDELRLFFCSAEYYTYDQGPHSRLRCTDCHEQEEVYVIPHQVKTPVDCTRTCHLSEAVGFQIEFSHKSVAETLSQSAHGTSALSDVALQTPLLRPNQSECLYCHDQPLFRLPEVVTRRFPHGQVERCEVCHTEELPVDSTYFTQHVASRFQQARPMRQLAQTCAVCHSDPVFLEKHDKHDAIASYLHSFHGKAGLLGNTDTATCVDCHASESGNFHAMLGKDEPGSSVNGEHLPTTCRSNACHPGAAPGISAAAVHLQIDPNVYPVEYAVAAAFVLLTAGVMLLFFMFIFLELINTALRRDNPHHRRLVQLARHIQKTPEGRVLLQRMSIHERLQHWVLAISFILLVLTGLPIKFADADWASELIGVFGGLAVARWIHRICGVTLMLVFLYHVIYLIVRLVQRVRHSRRSGKPESIWRIIMHSPMFIDLDDLRGFVGLFGYLLRIRRERPHFGYMSLTQKFEYWAVFWGTPILGVTGLLMWGTPHITEFVSGRVLNFAFIVHSDEAYLAFIYIAVVHMFSVFFSPAVFPMSLGTLTGQAPARELAEGHIGQLEEAARKLNLPASPPPPRRGLAGFLRQLVRRSYAAGMAAVCFLLAFVSLRFLVGLLVGHDAAPIQITDIPKRLDATALTTASLPEAMRSSAAVRPRGPLAHFHQIPEWYQPDPGNTCATAGCHPALPHGERIEVRAFLNMHATFLDCTVCHLAQHEHETAGWLSLPARLPVETPAILRLADLLARTETVQDEQARGLSEQLQTLLREAIAQAGRSQLLSEWLLRLETIHPEGVLFRALLAEMQRGIQLYMHGSYAAKIAFFEGAALAGAPTAEQRAAGRRFLRENDAMDEAQRQNVLDAVHDGLVDRGPLCARCHTADEPMLDLAALGYPQPRIDAMRDSLVVQQITSIEQGQEFHLPRIVETTNRAGD